MTAAVHEHTRISPWAVASVLCSLIFFCPLTTALGVIFGLWGLWDIHRHPQRTGNGVAFTGLVIGALCTGGIIAFGIWWNDVVRRPMLYGPYASLVAGSRGDIQTFKSGFIGPGATAGDDAAQQFFSRLSNRYGAFVASQQDAFGASDSQASLMQTGSARIAYELTFTGQTVQALGHYVLRDANGNLVSKFRYLAVFDSAHSPLVFPPSLADQAVSDRQTLREQMVDEAIEEEQQRQPNGSEQSPAPGGSLDEPGANGTAGERGPPR